MDCWAGRKQKRQKKKAGTIAGPGLVLAGCPDKLEALSPEDACFAAEGSLYLCYIDTNFENLKLETTLSASARSHCQVPHLRQNARHLHPVQLRNEWQDFGNELIFHQFADFFLAAAFSAAEQFGHSNLQCTRQPFQGRQRRRGLLVFDFGHVRSRHGHSSGQLPLAETAAQS